MVETPALGGPANSDSFKGAGHVKLAWAKSSPNGSALTLKAASVRLASLFWRAFSRDSSPASRSTNMAMAPAGSTMPSPGDKRGGSVHQADLATLMRLQGLRQYKQDEILLAMKCLLYSFCDL